MSKNASLDVAAIKSKVIAELPRVCSDETAAVEWFEAKRWPDGCACIDCGSVDVYQMQSRKGGRQANFRWRCKDCGYQFTVKTGTVFEDSPVPMHKWIHALWLSAASKKGVAALELQRTIQVAYRTALYMLHRIRFCMGTEPAALLDGVVEVDETYLGGKPRRISKQERERAEAEGREIPKNKRGAGTKKTPIVVAVQRDGSIKREAIANITAANLKQFLRGTVALTAEVVTDELNVYPKATEGYAGHRTTNHAQYEFARVDADGFNVHSNTAESSHSLLKRGLIGVWHRMSVKRMPYYLANCDFLWNTRRVSDGDRVLALVRSVEGKRLTVERYRAG
ncbi:MAG: IS1595 family transposase [Longimicrobiaceae bacterium]